MTTKRNFETWYEVWEAAQALADLGYRITVTGWSGQYALWLHID